MTSDSGVTESPGLGMRFIMYMMRSNFPNVNKVETSELAKWIQNKDRDVVLLDCRGQNEYDVSHLPQSTRVDWQKADVLKLLQSVEERKGPANKTIVCYCALGFRGSAMAQKIQEFNRMKENTANMEVYSLLGAIFKWANEGRPLIDSHGQKTTFVHPHVGLISRLLKKSLRKW